MLEDMVSFSFCTLACVPSFLYQTICFLKKMLLLNHVPAPLLSCANTVLKHCARDYGGSVACNLAGQNKCVAHPY